MSVAPDNLEGQGHGSSGSLYVQPPSKHIARLIHTSLLVKSDTYLEDGKG